VRAARAAAIAAITSSSADQIDAGVYSASSEKRGQPTTPSS
jgi:hypothetical protein